MQGIHAHYAQFHYIHTALELNERFYTHIYERWQETSFEIHKQL